MAVRRSQHSTQARASGPPNVIVWLTDQQRWDTTGVHGNPLDLTPNFDRAAREGTHFFNAFTCQPVCAPARSSLQTGLYATETGVISNRRALAEDAVTLATCFRAGGYRTGYIGKWHLGGVDPHVRDWKQGGVPPARRGGYEYWLASDTLEFTSDAYHTTLFDTDGRPVSLPGYRVDALTDAAIRYIDANREQPFFLFVSFLEPHHQNHLDSYPAPRGYAERYAGRWMPPDLAALGGTAHGQIAGYYGQVKRIDEAFGRMLDALESLGIAESTNVIFLSDHGNHFRTRNGEYKRSCHESAIRVPVAACGPSFHGGGRFDRLFSLVDVAPTLLDSASLPVPRKMQGHSALGALHGASREWQDDVFIQISESQIGRAVRTRRWKYGVTARGAGDPAEVPASDEYVEEYLYDLEADPYELRNLAGLDTHAAVSARLRERLLARIRDVERATPVIVPADARTDEGQRVVFPSEIDE